MAKSKTTTDSLPELKVKLVRLLLDIRAGKEKNTSSVKLIKRQIAQLLSQQPTK